MRSCLSFLCLCSYVFTGCSPAPKPELKTGIWRAVIELQGQQLPFTFRVATDSEGGKDVYLRNINEEILLDEVTFNGNQVDIGLHVFDAHILASVVGDSLNGLFILNYRDSKLPFKAAFGNTYRFKPTDTTLTTTDFSGKYQVLFSNEMETIPAIGIFTQHGNYANGTFLTPVGDYRFIEGGVFDDTLMLSTFDGNHTYLFKAVRQNDSTLQGKFWSGKNEYYVWSGNKSTQASLPDPESVTYLRKGYNYLTFSFPDINGNKVSLSDDRFKNKVVVLQLFGTWCPNGMDVTKFLTAWYPENKARGIEVLGLAYERKGNFRYASERIRILKEKWKVPYDILVAGVMDKNEASKTLPQLNRIASFPTTIFIGRDGKVKHIYSGFEGPGTGPYHQQFIERFNELVNDCLTE